MSQISQLSKLAISDAVCITAGVPHTTSPVPQQPNLLLADTFMTKARFYHFFLHQTQSRRDGNVRTENSVADIIYSKSGFGPASASGPSTQEVGHVGVG